MELSEAILLGCKQSKRRTTEDYFDFNDKGKVVGSCALGAAYLGLGYSIPADEDAYYYNGGMDSISDILHTKFTLENPVRERCPARGCSFGMEHLEDLVVHLNDYHCWKRSKIAKHLKRLGY